MDKRITTAPRIILIHASDVLITASRRPIRAVMYKLDDQYIVHDEILKFVSAPTLLEQFSHFIFENGVYCPYKTKYRPLAPSELEARIDAKIHFDDRVSHMRNMFGGR